VALEKALDRSEAEGMPLLRQSPTQLLDRHVRRVGQDAQDQVLASFDPSGPSIAAQGFWARIALIALALTPAALTPKRAPAAR
jgi:hypothetical protein